MASRNAEIQSTPAAMTSKPARNGLIAHVLTLLALPLLVLWRQDNVLFSRAGYIDPWFYVGYAKNLVEFKRDTMAAHYTGSRLAWILPCFAVHALFQPVAAAYVLHLSVWALGVLSLYFALRMMVGSRAALITAILMGTHSWFWYATGWDYPDGAAMACVLLATAFFTLAARTRMRRVALFLAGLAGATALHCNLGWLGLSPLFPLPYLFFAWSWQKRPVWRSALDALLWSGLGAILITAALAVVNLRLDGNPWFYMPSFRQGSSLASQRIRWLAGVWSENGLSPSLWLPAITAGIVAFVLIHRLSRRATADSTPALVFAVQCLCTLAFLCYFQRTEAHGLSYPYYASDMIPFSFLLIGTAFWKHLDELSTRAWLSLCGAAIAISAFFWYDYAALLVPAQHPAWLFALLGAGLLFAGLWMRDPKLASALAIAGFALFTVESRFAQEPDPHMVRRTYEGIMHVRARLESVRHGRPILFWIDKDDPNAWVHLSFASTYIQAIGHQNSSLPGFPCNADPSAVDPLVAMSSRPGALELAEQAVSRCVAAARLTVHSIPLGAIERSGRVSNAVLLLVEPDPAVWHPLQVVLDSSGGASMVAAQSGGAPPIPLAGWSHEPSSVPAQAAPNGLLVETPSDNFGVTFRYAHLKAPLDGRYRFTFRYRVRFSMLIMGVRDSGELRWKGSAASNVPDALPDQAVVTVDLKQGEDFELAFTSLKNGPKVPSPSVLLQEVTVWRRDLPR
jgi:hypothetical protein